MHSRNSCKTLKCPRCNWHYKYQETLEIHMKEKHPENENSCFFCLSNQSHPRLARGETYTCGYKPYRCDVCNYSTTTKGNLSIHMTSDKHMTNMQYDASANKLAMGVVAAAAAANNNNNNNNTRDSTASPSNSSSASANGGQLTNTSSEQASINNNNQFGADDSVGQQQSLATSISNALALAAAAANNTAGAHNSSSSASSSPISGLNQQQQQQNPFTTTSSNNINLTQATALMTSGGQFAPAINSQSKISQEAMNMLQQQFTSASPAAAAITTSTSSSSPNAINNTSDSVSGNAALQDQSQQQPQQTAAALAAILLAQQNPNALEDYINSQEIAKDSYEDPSRKYKCHRCKVAFTRQSYLTAHNKTLFHRKGEKLAYPIEKYLDPNRPFKCDICKESFTQKSILLVHNNSVSHLNKLRQSKKLQQQANSADQALPQQITANGNNDRSTTSTPINTNVNNLITSTPPQNAFGSMSPQVSQALQQHLQNQQATTSASNTNMPAANALASHLGMLQQQAANPLAAALQADPMSALMAGGNPMAALLMASAGQMSHPMMPFMMNPQLMAAAALAAAHSSRAMLDPQAAAAAAAASMFQQPQLTPKSAASPSAPSNPFLDFQNQQQQLMQQAANQLAAAVASQAGPTIGGNQNDIRSSHANTQASSTAAYSLGNLLANQGVSAADFIQQSLAAAGNPLQALVGGNKLTSDALMNSALDSLKNHSGISINNSSCAPPMATSTPITSSAPSNNQHHQAQNDQAAAAAAAAAAALSVQQQKRARTRISEDQLRILRQYFDINNSPTEEQLQEMSVKSELPLKVIKHWFRNTLFKERQKNKDSPYNFNNPPMLALNLEEYERTGEAKVTPISDLVSQSMNQDQAVVAAAATTILNSLNNIQQQASSLITNSSTTAPVKDEYEFTDSLVTKEDSIEETAAAVVRDVVDAVASNEAAKDDVLAPSGGGPDASPLKRTRSSRNASDVKRLRSNNDQDKVKKEILEAQQQLADNSNNPYLSQSERLMILFNNLQRQGSATAANPVEQQAGGGPRRDCDSDSAQDSDDSQGSSFSANNNNNSPDDAKLKNNTGNSKHPSGRKTSQQANRQLRRSKRFDQADNVSPVQDENAGIGPSSTWSPLQLQQQLFDQTWATVNNHLNNNSDNANRQGLSSKTSDSSSHSVNSNNSKSKRANRTRFSDQQVKVLQEFFEQNAYPKDDDLECLSKQLGLSPRVIVVWFQNARQKARKVYENRPTSASMSEGDDEQIMSMNQTRSQNQSFSFNTSGTCDSPTSGTGGPHSPTSSMMSNNDHHNQSRAPSQHQATLMQQRQLEQFFMNQLDRGANRNGADDDDEMDANTQGDTQTRASRSRAQKRSKREFEDEHNDGDDEIDGEEGDDEHANRQNNNEGEEEEDDDEFMSAAQMMRHQQQQQQQQCQQLAAAAAGLFSGDPASLLQQLFAANQQHGGSSLFQQQQQPSTDINQRNVMEALSNAMRAAAASSGVASANTIGGAATNNNAGANNGLMSHLMDGGSQASMISSGGGAGTGANNRHGASATNGGLISASSTSSNNTTTTTSTTTSTSSASQRDKRLRTQISPEQLDYLYQKYQVESNPSRKTLESIAQDVGLSKRVVQVWFQNTRARERRGQLRMSHVFAQQQRSQAAAAAAAAAAAVLDLSART